LTSERDVSEPDPSRGGAAVPVNRTSQRAEFVRTLAIAATATAAYLLIVRWDAVLALWRDLGHAVHG
jgi:hypothetical protein